MSSPPEKRNIVIVGGGIIGCTTAYFLTRHPAFDPSRHAITLIEASEIAGGASGKAGGLLALWAYPRNIVPLSYGLHADLAKEHGGAERWGYRKLHCGQVAAKGRPLKEVNGNAANGKGESVSLHKRHEKFSAHSSIPKDLDWVAPDAAYAYDEMGTPETTAQVHPYQFTTSMAALAQEKGVKIVYGIVNEMDRDTEVVKFVSYKDNERSETKTIEATDVIITAGPWTQRIYPPAPISGLRAHSVTIRPTKPLSAYALFTEIALPANFGQSNGSSRHSKQAMTVTPEIYARPNDEIYACGEGDTLVPLPETTADVVVDDGRCQDIIDYVGCISDELRDGEVLVRQACYLPNVEGRASGPLIGHTGVKGLYLAAGHTCWGIQNGPGTGKLMSEFVFDGKAKSANIGQLDPRKWL
ncbi:hypothetical protein MMC25_005295 [Agyrium rufum]|nr:hypothetical protein [Agyrium rufum]